LTRGRREPTLGGRRIKLVHNRSMEAQSKKRLQSERTRALLIREATKLFAKRGFDGTFIDEVARRGHVTKGALYHQFSDKKDLFEAVLSERVAALIHAVQQDSADHAEQLGIPSKAPPRYLAGLEMLIQRLCEPPNRRILLLDGPVVLGRAVWDELFAGPMRKLIYSVFWAGVLKGDVRPELVEPLSYMLYGALQEIALAIGQAKAPEAARAEFGAAAFWVLERLLRSPDES
jgi:AcrR family transcriptional regulator